MDAQQSDYASLFGLGVEQAPAEQPHSGSEGRTEEAAGGGLSSGGGGLGGQAWGPPEPAELRLAIIKHRDAMLATVFLATLDLAIDCEPEIVRRSLARVFDLGAVQECHKRMMLVLGRLQEQIRDATHRLDVAAKRADELERQVDYFDFLREGPA